MTIKSMALAAGLAFAVATGATGIAAANEPLISADGFPGEFSANVALTSEYYFRGVSQTDDAPAIQGGFDWSAEVGSGVGVYLGAWGSNVDFNEGGTVDGATVEIDFYGGLTGDIGNTGIGWDVGLIYYAYPGAADALDYDFVEVQGALSYDLGFASTAVSLNYSPDNFGGSGEAYYLKGGVDVPVGKYLTISAHVAKQWIEKNDVFGLPNYIEWGIGGTVNVMGFDVNLAWTDTDHSDSECSDACGMVLLTVSRTF